VSEIEKKLPGAIIFITGFVTMAFEIAGSRVLGPYFGSSVFVWTSLIGIIMGSLSAGYWLGGFLSTRTSGFGVLMIILSVAAFFILITATANIYILDRVVKYVPGLRLQTVVSSVILFGPASIGFGMVLPLGVKLSIRNVTSSGGMVGNLYALSTVGSILGTFAAGFLLVPAFGFSNILYVLSLLLIVSGFTVMLVRTEVLPAVVNGIVLLLVVFFWLRALDNHKDYIDTDTVYNRVIVYETKDVNTGRPIRMLRVNDENSSAMFLDGDHDLVFEVLKYYRLIGHFVPDFRSALMIGGSGYAFPKDYLERYPQATLDVVEIDPGLTAIARKYFNLKPHPKLRIYHEDGRTFLNSNEKIYDAVLMDAYKSMITIPYQLTTVEAVQKIHDALSPQGVVMANIISTLNPENNHFLQAEVATYRSVFQSVLLFAVQYPDPSEAEKKYFQNFMLVGIKSGAGVSLSSLDPELNSYLQHLYLLEVPPSTSVLTDEYAPVEFFASKALK
jgi:spermidine synthase